MDNWQWIITVINLLGALASIIALCITFLIYRRISKIEESFTRQALIPIFHSKLGGAIKNLKQYQRSKDAPQIRLVLIVCRSNLEDLLDHLDHKRVERVNQVIHIIKQLLPQSDENLWNQSGLIIAEIEGIHETVGNLKKEMQWRGRDANYSK
jgi:hypothetical protein